MLIRGREAVERLLASHYPSCISPQVDNKLRQRFEIILPADAMRPLEETRP